MIWTWVLSWKKRSSKEEEGLKKREGVQRGPEVNSRASRLVFLVLVWLWPRRVYVFARLHQMIYSRLLEAKGLCRQKNRQDRLAAEPHQVRRHSRGR